MKKIKLFLIGLIPTLVIGIIVINIIVNKNNSHIIVLNNIKYEEVLENIIVCNNLKDYKIGNNNIFLTNNNELYIIEDKIDNNKQSCHKLLDDKIKTIIDYYTFITENNEIYKYTSDGKLIKNEDEINNYFFNNDILYITRDYNKLNDDCYNILKNDGIIYNYCFNNNYEVISEDIFKKIDNEKITNFSIKNNYIITDKNVYNLDNDKYDYLSIKLDELTSILDINKSSYSYYSINGEMIRTIINKK